MGNRVIWSLVGAAALAATGLVTGCDSDTKLARSAEHESCAKTSDCDDGLRCYQAVCVQPAEVGTGMQGAGGDEQGAAGSPTTTPTPPPLGGPGETCTKRADCADGLACLSGRCQTESTGAGGDTGGPSLGGPGETCGLTSDCQAGLTCLPNNGIIFPEERVGTGQNVCTPTDNGLEPTGKECGAECLTADDCCELPVEFHATVGADSCAALTDLIGAQKCDTAVAGTQLAAQCFAQTAYCECGAKTWACNAGKCLYTATCTKNVANSPGGCAALSRTGLPLTPSCDVTGTKKCEIPTEPQCKVTADCVGLFPVGGITKCLADECTCAKSTGQCYRACQEDLDCPAQYACNTKTSLCEHEPGCTSDAQCVVSQNDTRYKCFDGTCALACSNDLDCNFGRLTNGASTQICGADKRCAPVGCESDTECPGTFNNVRLFCGEKAPAMAAPSVVGAITD